MGDFNPVQLIAATEDRFNQIAPAEISFAAERGFAMQLLKTSSYLMKVASQEPESLQHAVVNVAAIGLSLNPAEKLCYLIPRKVKIGNEYRTLLFLDVSYMGFCRLATNAGAVKWIQANLVYSNDEFAPPKPGDRPEHNYDPFASIEERGDFKGAYCVAKVDDGTEEGSYLTTTMRAERVLEIMERSESVKTYRE